MYVKRVFTVFSCWSRALESTFSGKSEIILKLMNKFKKSLILRMNSLSYNWHEELMDFNLFQTLSVLIGSNHSSLMLVICLMWKHWYTFPSFRRWVLTWYCTFGAFHLLNLAVPWKLVLAIVNGKVKACTHKFSHRNSLNSLVPSACKQDRDTFLCLHGVGSILL